MASFSAWGISWAGSWGSSWGPLHEVEDETVIGGGGSNPFTGYIPKTKDDEVSKSSVLPEAEKPIVYPAKHPWIHFPNINGEVTPELADAVIESVAETVEKRTVQNKDVETAQAEKSLREFLASREQHWKNEYAQLIALEYERREQEYEDAQIAMILFEM
jgi:hypothetical protein